MCFGFCVLLFFKEYFLFPSKFIFPFLLFFLLFEQRRFFDREIFPFSSKKVFTLSKIFFLKEYFFLSLPERILFFFRKSGLKVGLYAPALAAADVGHGVEAEEEDEALLE